MSDIEPRQQLRIQKEIRRSEDDLVLAIQSALDDTNSYGDLEEAQFRNLVRVSDTTESTEVIKNFLKYQVGRYQKWGRGDKSLATQIIKDIDLALKQRAESIAAIVQLDKNKQAINSIWLDLTRRYLGYGARYLTYKRKGESKS